MLTIKANERLFEYIELRKSVLTKDMEPNKGKALTLLRYCNDLLRRLSKTQHTVFSGRILLFLTGVFSLTERSGVNLKGDFNTDNVTVVVDDQTLFVENPMDVDAPLEISKDRAFYKTFWSLQRYFSDPMIVIKKLDEWAKMESAIESVLQVFEAENESDLKSGSDRKRKAAAMSSLDSVAASTAVEKELDLKDDYFFPKFLTSHNLFELQIKDISFRRQIMVQMLIIFQFFMGLTKHAAEAALATTTNKSMPFLSFSLTDAQETWVNQIRARVVRIVEQTTPNGRRFLTTLTTVITHEANWIKWKAESCPNFEKRLQEKLDVKKKFLEHSLAIHKDFTGSQELNVLKMAESNPTVLLTEFQRRNGIQPLADYLAPLAEQLNEDGTVAEGVEDEYLHSNNKTFNWRAYRTALGSHFHLFREVENIDTKMLVKKMRMDEEAGKIGDNGSSSSSARGASEEIDGKGDGETGSVAGGDK
ncbi:THO complex, subunit THOC1 [Obelidium mucronatum]|nr:THO complex, subunit THOC1 [Obelidium mucronatum]